MSQPAGTRVARSSFRSFVAILLPEAVRARLAAAARELEQVCAERRAARRVAWVRAESLHVTLHFLGALGEAAVVRVGEALEEVGRQSRRFDVSVAGLGSFPAGRPPRVIWAGVDQGAALLAELQRRVETALEHRGFPPDRRRFHAHVTLGRAREGTSVPLDPPTLDAGQASFGVAPVDAIVLMRSELAPGGSRYSAIVRVALGGDAARVDAPEGGP